MNESQGLAMLYSPRLAMVKLGIEFGVDDDRTQNKVDKVIISQSQDQACKQRNTNQG